MNKVHKNRGSCLAGIDTSMECARTPAVGTTDTPWALVVPPLCLALVVIWQRRGGTAQAPALDLSTDEVDEICNAWRPAPLVCEQDLRGTVPRREAVVTEQRGVFATVDGVACVTFACFDFLHMHGDARILRACEAAILKYGVGSCGPRGFYGTADVHLALERELAAFTGAEAGVVYSYDAAVAASILPAFVKPGDLVVCDEGVAFAVQAGVRASRAHVYEFRHNDVRDLADILSVIEEADRWRPWRALNRRFIVVEGLYANSGLVCPLAAVVALAQAHRFRVFLEESMSFGVLGASGRGACEHHGVAIADVAIVSASMSTALASVGGFAVSDRAIASRQRLSSTGYCFSASLPQFNAVAGSAALATLLAEPERVATLRANAEALHALLEDMCANMDEECADALCLLGDAISPVKHLHLVWGGAGRAEDEARLQRLCDAVLESARMVLVVADYSPLQRRAPRASIRIAVSAGHTREMLEHLVAALAHAVGACGQTR